MRIPRQAIEFNTDFLYNDIVAPELGLDIHLRIHGGRL